MENRITFVNFLENWKKKLDQKPLLGLGPMQFDTLKTAIAYFWSLITFLSIITSTQGKTCRRLISEDIYNLSKRRNI